MEVKTGLLGLGAHLFIPLSTIQETLNDCVFVARPKEEFESLGWDDKPAYLDELKERHAAAWTGSGSTAPIPT
jgi:hypothetical protein